MPNQIEMFAYNGVCKPAANFVQTKIEYMSVSDAVPVQRANQCIRYHTHNRSIHTIIYTDYNAGFNEEKDT